MTYRYLIAEEILRIHYQVIEDYGGSHGVRDEKSLKSLVEAPKQLVFGTEQYVGTYQKAAVYVRNIVGDHPFTDGNKPTAVTVCGIFLSRCNASLIASPAALEDFVVSVAVDHLSIDEIAAWLENNSSNTK